MLTLFELLNLPVDCGFKWVPVYLVENGEWCRVWEWQEPPLTCDMMQSCIDATYIHSYLSSPLSTIDITLGDTIELDLDPATLQTLVWFSWAAPVLTVGNTSHNLSNLLLASKIYWNISDPEQRADGRPLYTIGNKEWLKIWPIDGMRHFFDNDPLSPTYQYWVVWLPTEFITTPLWAPSIYNYEYRVTAWQDYYNPRRYVLTRYSTFAIDWESRNCGRAVWAEPQCCMQTLVVDGCMLGLGGGDACNWRCQTIRDQVNWTERVNICNVFNQELTYQLNNICYQLPWATQSDPYIDVCIDISETNNHYLLTYPGSEVDNHLLELYNHNGELQTAVDLWFMFNQQLVHNEIPVTPQPAHPVPATINNTICITQPLGAPDQCVDLNRVNNQELTLTPDWYLIINSQLFPENNCDLDCSGRMLDMREYFAQRWCDVVCNCVMDSVPDWSSIVTVTPGGFRDTFLAGNPSVYEVLYMLRSRYVINFNRVGPLNITSRDYQRPCWRYSDTLSASEVPQEMCNVCCEPCGWWSTTTNITELSTSYITNITNQLEGKKYYAKRWIGEVPATPNYIEIQQTFNGTLDPGGGAEFANIWRSDFWSDIDQRYWYDPASMPASQMTLEPTLMANSAIKCIKKGIYEMFIDWPIRVNHYVHAFRIAAIVERGGEHIIVNDRKMWGDPFSGSGSVNNGYFKENKFYYVSSYKNVELEYWDILTLHVKIDANTSWPYLDTDPMTLGEYLDSWSTWDGWSNRPFDSARWGNNGTLIQYGTINSVNFPGDTWFARQQYNGYGNTSMENTWDVASGPYTTWSPAQHNHVNYIMLPGIPPHAPNYINLLPPAAYPTDGAVMGYVTPAAEGDRPSLLYPGRFLQSDTNPNNDASTNYQPGTAVIRFIWPSTGGDNGTTYPAMPPYWATFPYSDIASSTWFMFGIRRQQGVWSSQIEDFT